MTDRPTWTQRFGAKRRAIDLALLAEFETERPIPGPQKPKDGHSLISLMRDFADDREALAIIARALDAQLAENRASTCSDRPRLRAPDL